MVKIGNEELNASDNELLVVFFLRKKSKITLDEQLIVDGINWFAKIYKNSFVISAKTNHKLRSYKDYVDLGYKAMQRLLDIASISGSQALTIDYDHTEQLYLLYDRIGTNVTFEISTSLFQKIEVEINVVAKDINGNVIKSHNNLHYVDSLRYYRMSLLSQGLIDAYKYLYLAVESALNIINSKIPGIKEIDWLTTSISIANGKSKKPLVYSLGIEHHFKNNHYLKYRLKLFHSKNNIILPMDNYDLTDLYDAYIDLYEVFAITMEVAFGYDIKKGSMFTEHAINSAIESLKIDRITFQNEEKSIDQTMFRNVNINQIKAKNYSGITTIELTTNSRDTYYEFNKINFGENDHMLINLESKEKIQLRGIDTIRINLSILFTNKNYIDRPFLW